MCLDYTYVWETDLSRRSLTSTQWLLLSSRTFQGGRGSRISIRSNVSSWIHDKPAVSWSMMLVGPSFIADMCWFCFLRWINPVLLFYHRGRFLMPVRFNRLSNPIRRTLMYVLRCSASLMRSWALCEGYWRWNGTKQHKRKHKTRHDKTKQKIKDVVSRSWRRGPESYL